MQYNEKKAQAHLARATQLLRESDEDLGFGVFHLRGYKERRALRNQKRNKKLQRSPTRRDRIQELRKNI